MWPDRVSNPGPLTYESSALPTALRGPAALERSAMKLLGGGGGASTSLRSTIPCP